MDRDDVGVKMVWGEYGDGVGESWDCFRCGDVKKHVGMCGDMWGWSG